MATLYDISTVRWCIAGSVAAGAYLGWAFSQILRDWHYIDRKKSELDGYLRGVEATEKIWKACLQETFAAGVQHGVNLASAPDASRH